jgi:hypothetical protein
MKNSRGNIANKALGALFGQTGQIQHLQIVFRDESQMALLLRRLGQETRDKAVTRGLWNVHNWKAQPSQKWRKYLIAACAANNSRSNVEQWDSVSVNFLEKKPSGRQWSTDIYWMTPSIGGVSCKRKFSLWGSMLEVYRCGQEAFYILESLLCQSDPLQCFRHPLQEINQRVQCLCTFGQKTEEKIYHAEKTLQLLDVLGGGDDLILAVWPALGADPVAKIAWPRISKEGTAKTHFSRFSPLFGGLVSFVHM